MPAALLGLPRSRRLKQRRDFMRLRQNGRRVVCGCLVLNWTPAATAAGTRLGVVTSKQVGPAVTRNRGRRLLREAFRRHQHELAEPADLVLVGRQSLATRSFEQVEADFLKALRQSGLLKLPA